MIIAQVSVSPIGTGSTSISNFVAEAVRVLKRSGLNFTITPMGTILEAKNLKELFEAIESCHNALFNAGAKRVYTVILIDDRRDIERTMFDKVKSVEEKLKGQT
ncbi:MAG: MTH1187 family thiamine-binding protein [Candidatus Nezhaarchaeota archaeon]|nr:MTH1187 family thiamine-binding protein [Candidatus Nezhaarchaeota archaeon]MCX8142284.1 MTH1187 family thiamine-binding protein [Candidatus Nezhaarchaeota archaeon]MDW8050743.1 MTH1187 family thiamine-binding protein [Nitrososphaerota archaeon]